MFYYSTMVAIKKYSSKKRKTLRVRKTIKKSTKSRVSSNTKKINALVTTMNNVAEQKIQSLANIYQAKPKPQEAPPATGPLYYYNACLGNPAQTWVGPTGQPNFEGLDGFQWSPGTGSNQRIGRYLYLKHTTMQMRLAMLNTPQNATPTMFRTIVFKAKRNSALGSAGGNPNDDLLLDNSGRALGVNNTGSQDSKTFEYMNMLVNKRNYSVVLDTKCILQPSLVAVQGATPVMPLSTSYPSEKTYSLKLNHNSKTAFSNFNAPLDLNYQYCIQVLSAPMGNVTTLADDWRISFRGTVSCIDS